ncbi:phage tail assembly chaperone [Lutimaribacter sp. EGI FJ00015]|uniref:Phage tail assembly chaperone n=1 Tax=Lutimaribacter degradans TaxID=2945989 RepID=A0ACC5ZRT1_9RHOB|nr:rcc01693 family protein [Lutimaribacter sp. EGI FJ00013]MCM2561038.1 phage tail assembly chaperone [Lutimaribacter sp. EGI FJ00013]MCO0612015.1 phage tail assembly chaperone [Lutimaribacter sp. EGI FJ00015]MCO0634865.1 phage tail assembly chaperone [Lutimaribacter sp. EGI FJ00014]
MSVLDWPGMMRAGLVGLRLAPDQFWALTPAELMVMLGKGASAPPMGRHRLEEMLAAFPDTRKGVQDD